MVGCWWLSGLSGEDLSRDMSVLCPYVSVKEMPRGEQIPPVRCSVQRLSRQDSLRVARAVWACEWGWLELGACPWGQPGPWRAGDRVQPHPGHGTQTGPQSPPATTAQGHGAKRCPSLAGPSWAAEAVAGALCGGAAAPPAPLPGVQTPAGASRQASFVWGRWAGSGGLGREVAP